MTRHYLRDAVAALLAGQAVPEAETKAVGCSIKFRAPDPVTERLSRSPRHHEWIDVRQP